MSDDNTLGNEKHTILASEIHLEESEELKNFIWGEDPDELLYPELEGTDEDGEILLWPELHEMQAERMSNRIKAQHHGFDYDEKNMYSKGVVVSMKHKVFSGFLFDKNGHMAGFELLCTKTDTKTTIVPPEIDTDQLKLIEVDAKVLTSSNKSRVVGLRTTKECSDSSQIKQIQPIFYSVDPQMCDSYLKPLTQNLRDEIPAYGKECEASFNRIPSLTMAAQAPSETQAVLENAQGPIEAVTIAFVWISFFLVLSLVALQIRSQCLQKSERVAKKRIDLLQKGKSPAAVCITENVQTEAHDADAGDEVLDAKDFALPEGHQPTTLPTV